MKVICIDENFNKDMRPQPMLDCIYTVVGEMDITPECHFPGIRPGKYYVLAEFKPTAYWHSENFRELDKPQVTDIVMSEDDVFELNFEFENNECNHTL